jgi:predicted ribosome quality control (RQC) complex YloA/Tae2 family protein
MINLDSLTLKLFLEENKSFFIGAKIQKIQQPNRHELIFYIRNFSETKKFYINFNPSFYHICFMSPQNEQKRYITIPKTAPMFCMLLRKYIQNAKISRVEVPKYERIFEIYFDYYDELNEKTELCLAIELMGKYSNVILYNYDTNVIIGCAHNVSSEKSRERELYGLLPYIYPPKQKKKNLTKTTFENFKETVDINNLSQSIASKYHYLTMSFVQDLINSKPNFSLKNLYDELITFLNEKAYYPCISTDYSKFFLKKMQNTHKSENINTMIDDYFSYHQNLMLISNLKSKIIKHVNTQLNKLNALKSKQEIVISKLDKALIYKNKADIIMSNLYTLKQGMKNAQLYDFEGKKVEIELDENKTPTENANKYYTLYKKTKTAYEHASLMIEETNSQILYFEEMKYFVESSNNMQDLQDMYLELIDEKTIKEEKAQNIDFIVFEGVKIYIGKNKKQNDYILSKLSSSEDLWFHPLNIAGAHILVKKNNSKDEISDNVLLKAAQITKEYSSQKNNSKTSIIYTKRKYVKKANNKLAFVTYKNETEIIV